MLLEAARLTFFRGIPCLRDWPKVRQVVYLLSGYGLVCSNNMLHPSIVLANGDGPDNESIYGPQFLRDNELPPGLVNNPSEAMGVDFKIGRAPRSQKVPDLTGKKATMILGLDNKPIKLHPETDERINVYHPDQFTLSADGSYVTSNETGEVIMLTVFYASDEKNELDITYSIDESGYLATARVSPKSAAGDEPAEGERKVQGKEKQVQNFQRLHNSDILVGYTDDDMDMTNMPVYGDMAPELDLPEIPIEEAKAEGGNRRAQATFPLTRFGKTCNTWDYLDVRIATDQRFKNVYSSHQSRAQAVFAEASEIYWLESCVYLYMWGYESTVSNSNWVTPWYGWSWDFLVGYLTGSGCGEFGALQIMSETVQARQNSAYRDAWHMFSGVNFDGNTIGCAWTNVCQSKTHGFGVNQITFTSNLRLQGVLFAHELGHNLGLNHLSSTNGYWVMEPSVNMAPFDLTPTHASNVNSKVVQSSSCGWY